MAKSLQVSCVQMHWAQSIEFNIERSLHYIHEAARAGSRVVLFPEAHMVLAQNIAQTITAEILKQEYPWTRNYQELSERYPERETNLDILWFIPIVMKDIQRFEKTRDKEILIRLDRYVRRIKRNIKTLHPVIEGAFNQEHAMEAFRYFIDFVEGWIEVQKISLAETNE